MIRIKHSLCLAILLVLVGCAQTSTIVPNKFHEVIGQDIATELEDENSVTPVINKAFLASELSQYAVDDTLLLFMFYTTRNDVAARDIESYVSPSITWKEDFAVIPRYEGSTIKIEQVGLDEHFKLAVFRTLVETTSTESYVLLIRDFFNSSSTFLRITVTYDGVSASYDMRFNTIGYLEQPSASDGCVLNMTPLTLEMAQELPDDEKANLFYRFDTQQTPPLNIHEFPTAEFLENFETLHTFTNIPQSWDDPERHNLLVFWPDSTLRDFSYFSVGFDGRDFDPSIGISSMLSAYGTPFTIDELRPQDAFVLKVVPPGHFAGGIMFTDESGVQRYMIISMGGSGHYPMFALGSVPFLRWHEEILG